MPPVPSVSDDIYRRLGHAWWDDDVGESGARRFWITGYAARKAE